MVFWCFLEAVWGCLKVFGFGSAGFFDSFVDGFVVSHSLVEASKVFLLFGGVYFFVR